MFMYKWQKEYLENLNKMDNEQLLDEYTDLAGGDDYDGCLTKRGEWEWKKIQKELYSRLVKIGFLSINDKIE